MVNKIDTNTICAIATPFAISAVGIIKISGNKALSLSKKIFKSKNQKTNFKSHQLYLGNIFNPKTNKDIDEVLLVYMKAPKSYTKEDLVEIHSHGNPFVLKQILELLIEEGARLASPGEFTKRAFLNGRIDLSQAEAVIDIINAKNTSSLQMAINLSKGNLKKQIQKSLDFLYNLLADIEAGIDFFEDIEDEFNYDDTIKKFNKEFLKELKKLLKDFNDFNFLRSNLNIVIAGSPNVGKSSIMNALLEKEKAIVTKISGTTRDVVEDCFYIDGLSIKISDTAGIHKTNNPIEKIGIEKSKETIANSDLVLFVVDRTKEISQNEKEIFNNIKNKKKIIIINKIDIKEEILKIPKDWKPERKVEISALKKTNIDILKKEIQKIYNQNFSLEENLMVPNLRQASLLKEALKSSNSFLKALKNKMPLEILSAEIQPVIKILSKITGENKEEDVLDNVFSKFCIGK